MTQFNVLDKIGLSIDQVSQMTGVKKTTLRYWEKEFSEYLKPDRTDTKRRQYSLEEVEKVAVLKQLIEEEKYKSAGVRLKLGLGSINQPLVQNQERLYVSQEESKPDG
jgi:DNA-binding transcriptional MerR regulator